MNEFKFWLKNHNYAWKYKLIVCLPLFALLTIIDWSTKIAVQFTMEQGETRSFLKGFISLDYIINPGSAYGANAHNVGLSIALATVVTIITLIVIIFINDKKWLIALVFIFAGSFDNLLARAWAPAVLTGEYKGTEGGVIDFLHWEFGFLNSNDYIFNIADMWVNIGIGLVIILLIYEIIMFIINVVKNKQNSTVDENSKIEQVEVVEIKKEKSNSLKIRNETEKEIKAKQKLQKMKEKQNAKKNNSKRK